MTETVFPDDVLESQSDDMAPAVTGLKAMIGAVLSRVLRHLELHRWPGATYRVQFNRDFAFSDATELASYWHQLGITDCYASPYLKASAGSRHGYDIVDHSRLNPELGSERDFQAFAAELRQHGMGHILDFVPNHMGIAGKENAWFQDVLENGPSSRFANYFDIDWHPLKTDLECKILLPVLGSQFGRALEDQELQLAFHQGAFTLRYYDRCFPIAPSSFEFILRHRLDELIGRASLDQAHVVELQSILTAISHLPLRHEIAADRREERDREKEVIKRRLQRLCDECPEILRFIEENVSIFNGQRGVPSSFDLLDQLLQQQAYRLSLWRVAADEINYRRFFDVNELAAICMERPEVFDEAHQLVLQLLDAGQVDGLRIDHADGLYDPTAYLWQLQERRFLELARAEFDLLEGNCDEEACNWDEVQAGLKLQFAETRTRFPQSPLLRSLYLVVEKILERTEKLPGDWPVHGTTGYEFLNGVNGLFVDGTKVRELDSVYNKVIGRKLDFDEMVYDAKRLILKVSMSSELHVLGHQLDRISEGNRWTRDFTRLGLIQALREVIACFPVYRTYTIDRQILGRDRDYIEQAIQSAKQRNPAVSGEVFDFIRSVLLHDAPAGTSAEEWDERKRFVGRFQQFTGPMMAKSVEDTAFYRFHRLVSLNEVGGDPRRVGITVEEFHQQNLERRQNGSLGMLATSTHDTKRSEDVRARINVLSEIPGEWKASVSRWMRWNRKVKRKIPATSAPSCNDEYLLYQTLVGAWPLTPPNIDELRTFIDRIQQYMVKAVREAKEVSSWIAPNVDYERALCEFIETILRHDSPLPFRHSFEGFVEKVIPAGLWNSLSQTLLKLTSPGVPDIYQGTELWDFSLVDPDNRRAVDFGLRRRLLNGLRAPSENGNLDAREFAKRLVVDVRDGRIKLFTISQTLKERRRRSELSERGDYVPLQITGRNRDHACAFARVWQDQWCITVVPRLVVPLLTSWDAAPLGPGSWHDTRLVIPGELVPSRMRNIFTGSPVATRTPSAELFLADVLHDFPVALIVNEP